jgi:hypothetical protein
MRPRDESHEAFGPGTSPSAWKDASRRFPVEPRAWHHHSPRGGPSTGAAR